MKRQEWSEEQLEQLLKQLPSVKDKQTAKDIFQSIQYKRQINKKSRSWITPAVATVAALLIFALISPFIFQNFTTNKESSMDMSTAKISEETATIENDSANDNKMAEANSKQGSNQEQNTLANTHLKRDKKETFVASEHDAEEIITVGFTDPQAQNIIPISLEANEKKEKLEQIEEVNPETYIDELGPISYELSKTDILETDNPEEINIEYNGEPNVKSSSHDMLYQNAIIETFRWLDYKNAKLYTNEKEGIEFGQTGHKKDLVVKKETKKAYFLYQFDEDTLKLLVPSPDPYDSVDSAFEAMKKGLEERSLKPTIMNNITTIKVNENGDMLEIEFNQGVEFENSEPTIIMFESILLTAKEFGYKTVQFNGINIDKVGVMDVTKPIEVPYSPNPIEGN
ncbi:MULTISPECIES: GerMN domain-containing protein [Metabacillus]|uniref:GerMN domain-containing protein n=2 Tax=Metabacillus TaxID=2675233 RepID=A0A179T1D7_9BACI|nr:MULTISPECIES: GerMN domain-containing protein [Metabacillus]OAS87434.1 hypothetical protein A6K24_19885 [Metabacillus litoralis]QNF30713.1 GerMN domain-containing protein [Metabacillus sp. KUDC1714]